MVKTFRDYYNNHVQLSFSDHPFSQEPKHVWVICRYDSKWLLTNHKERGLEFPGGKVESGETAEEAAVREVMEETGGEVGDLTYVAQYKVSGKKEEIVKNVYLANIVSLTKRDNYLETEGPSLVASFPENIKTNRNYSFIMKDDVLTNCLAIVDNE